MSGEQKKKDPAAKYLLACILLAGCLIISLIVNVIQFNIIDTEIPVMGAVSTETDPDSGKTLDKLNAGYGWKVYANVDSEESIGSLFSLFTEEEIASILNEEEVIFEVAYTAQSSPSAESDRYRIEISGTVYWVEVPKMLAEESIVPSSEPTT